MTAWNGTQRHTAATVSSAMTPTAAYGHCQPKSWPSLVVSGTPTMLATVSPTSIIDTAQVRRWYPTIEAATRAPMPKNAPCGRPEAKRAAISTG